MQVCIKCDGKGSREVQLSNGEHISKSCYVCGGSGFLPGTPAVAVMVPPQVKQKSPKKEKEISRPGPLERSLKELQPPPPRMYGELVGSQHRPSMRTLLSSPLGDLSFLGNKRLTHG